MTSVPSGSIFTLRGAGRGAGGAINPGHKEVGGVALDLLFQVISEQRSRGRGGDGDGEIHFCGFHSSHIRKRHESMVLF